MTANPHKRLYILAILLSLVLLSGASCAHWTALPLEHPASWKFAVISDTQGNNRDAVNKSCINDAVLRAIAEDIAKEKPDLVLVAGDLINGWFRNGSVDYDTQYSNWKKAMEAVTLAGIKIYPVRGNHDSGPERLALQPLPSHLEPPPDTVARMKETFRKHFDHNPRNGPDGEEGLTYSFVHKNAFFIGFDQYAGGQHEVHQDWMDEQLAGNRQPHVFVYGHEPAFEIHHWDNLAFYPKKRDAFWNALGRGGVQIYFCGHDHFYNRARIPDDAGRPIRQIIAGTGGGVLRKWTGRYADDRVKGEYHNGDHHGYVLVKVEGSKATILWKALGKEGKKNTWEIADTFSYSVSVRK